MVITVPQAQPDLHTRISTLADGRRMVTRRVHAHADDAPQVAARAEQALTDSARRWTGGAPVRFVADISIVQRWSQAKDEVAWAGTLAAGGVTQTALDGPAPRRTGGVT